MDETLVSKDREPTPHHREPWALKKNTITVITGGESEDEKTISHGEDAGDSKSEQDPPGLCQVQPSGQGGFIT